MKFQYKLIVILVVIGLFGALYTSNRILSKKLDRATNNYKASIEKLHNDNIENQRIYIVTISDLKKQFASEANSIKEDFDIKLKRAISYQNTNLITTNNINTILKDSVINDTINIQYAKYNDSWVDMKLLVIDDSVRLNLVSRDSIVCVVSYDKRNLWEWISGKNKVYRNHIKSFSPYTKVTTNEYIQIVKNNKLK